MNKSKKELIDIILSLEKENINLDQKNDFPPSCFKHFLFGGLLMFLIQILVYWNYFGIEF